MDVRSQHFLADVWLEQKLSEDIIDKIVSVVDKRLTVIERYRYNFEPEGVTLVYILAESHFAMHVYPENNYFSLDIYVCNLSVDLEDIFQEMIQNLKVLNIDKKNLSRGVLPTRPKTDLSNLTIKPLYPITFVVAACSILYELLLAQTLSAVMGNSILRYNLTIGIYIAAMGIGAMVFSRFKERNKIYGLAKTELLLSLVGLLSPILILAFDSGLQKLGASGLIHYHGRFIQFIIFMFNHSLIFLVGFLSGLELPYLMEMGKEKSIHGDKRVLSLDYIGTLFGAILFPLILFPFFKLFQIGLIIAFINCVIATYLFYLNDSRNKFFLILSSLFCMAIGVANIFGSTLSDYIVWRFY